MFLICSSFRAVGFYYAVALFHIVAPMQEKTTPSKIDLQKMTSNDRKILDNRPKKDPSSQYIDLTKLRNNIYLSGNDLITSL